MSLRIPDASQVDVVNDLLMLKSHGGDKDAERSQSAANTQRNSGFAGARFQVTSVEHPSGLIENLQSITAMKAYKEHSFEVKKCCL